MSTMNPIEITVRAHVRPVPNRWTAMLNEILPRQVDNTYRGYKLALWLFALLVLMKGGISLGKIFNGYTAAGSADGIPLDTFTPAGARAVVTLFALWGLSQLVICLLCVLVLVRYRAMVPFMFAVLLLEFLSRKLILQIMPIDTMGAPPGYFINLGLLALMIVGLVLSLWSNGDRTDERKTQDA
jgi:hypothetical protein